MSDTTANQFISQFADAAALAAFVPSPPAITPSASVPLSGYFAFQQDTGGAYSWNSDTAAWVLIGGSSGALNPLDLGSAGVRLSGANGVLTLLGLGGGADESLIIDLNTTANTIALSSGTGATVLDASTLGLTSDSYETAATDTGTYDLQGTPAKIAAVTATDNSWGLAINNAVNATSDYDIGMAVEGTTGVGQMYGGHQTEVGVLFVPSDFAPFDRATNAGMAGAMAFLGDLVTYNGSPAGLGRPVNPFTGLYTSLVATDFTTAHTLLVKAFDTNANPQTLTSLTSVSTVATGTKTSHGFLNGETLVISGAVQTEYNGTYAITVIDNDTFEYTFAGSGTSPATGTITATGGAYKTFATLTNGATPDFTIAPPSGGTVTVTGTTLGFVSYLETSEVSAPSNPASNGIRVYARDTGGKTELVAKFDDGSIAQIVIQP